MKTTRKTIQPSPKLSNNHFKRTSEEDFFSVNGTYIHPTAIIGKNVNIGKNVKIGPYTIILGNVQINDNTVIFSNISIGSPAQNLETFQSLGHIKIGKNVKIREFSSIGASKSENGNTVIGDNSYIMSYSHIAHDVVLEDNVTLVNNVNLGGHVHVGKNAFLMANSAAHQFCKIGEYSSLAPFSAIRQDIPPYCLFSGLPAKFYGLNLVALKRNNFSKESINSIKHISKLFYQDKLLLKDIIKLTEKNKNLSENKFVINFLKFAKNSKRGISRKAAI